MEVDGWLVHLGCEFYNFSVLFVSKIWFFAPNNDV